MFNFFKKKEDKESTDSYNSKKDARCPICEGRVIEAGDFYSCMNTLSRTCTFQILKKYNGKKFDISVIDRYSDFLNEKVVTNKVSLSLQEELQELEKMGEGAIKLRKLCNKCKSYMYKTEKEVRCSKCDFSMASGYDGVEFSAKQMEDLLFKKISEEHNFTNNGIGRVILKVDKDFNITEEYFFVKDISKLKETWLENYGVPSSECAVFKPIRFLVNEK